MKFLTKEGQVIDEIDLGMVFVGDSKIYEYRLVNDNGTDLIRIKIWFDIQTDEIQLLEAPEKLEKDTSGVVKIKWTPNLKIKQGLRTKIYAKAIEVWS